MLKPLKNVERCRACSSCGVKRETIGGSRKKDAVAYNSITAADADKKGNVLRARKKEEGITWRIRGEKNAAVDA